MADVAGIALVGGIGSGLAADAAGAGGAPRTDVLPGFGKCHTPGLLRGGCIVDGMVAGDILPGCRILVAVLAGAAVRRSVTGGCASICSAYECEVPRSG